MGQKIMNNRIASALYTTFHGKIYNMIGHVKLNTWGIPHKQVVFEGPVDIRMFDNSKIILQNATFLNNCQIWARQKSQIVIGDNFRADNNVRLNVAQNGKLTIKNNTIVNAFSTIDAFNKITIGNNCLIGSRVYITDSDHGTELGTPIAKQPMATEQTSIQDGVWIGIGVTILKGVTIGHDSIIGANAVVTKDIPPCTIAAGVPAKPIKKRS